MFLWREMHNNQEGRRDISGYEKQKERQEEGDSKQRGAPLP